jgi:hypothetical protein
MALILKDTKTKKYVKAIRQNCLLTMTKNKHDALILDEYYTAYGLVFYIEKKNPTMEIEAEKYGEELMRNDF